MDLKSGNPYWAIKNGLMCTFPQLEADITCDVVVMGGGITGALIADELANNDYDVAVVEQRDVAWGSSAACTGLLQYDMDINMVDLARRYGEAHAALVCEACTEAFTDLHDLITGLGDVDFDMQESLHCVSKEGDKTALREEQALRFKHDLDAQWLDSGQLLEHFGIKAPGAILTRLAARVDPYRLTSRLLMRLKERGGLVFDRTVIDSIETSEQDVTIRTPEGTKIRARHLVMAAGYDAQTWLRQSVAKSRSSYAFISDPIERATLGLLASTMVWESARPYLYMRTTGDGRLLVAGDDDNTESPGRRDRILEGKVKHLCTKVKERFPDLRVRPAYSWSGTFAETADGLPFLGAHPQYGPRVQFAMAYGGNGILFSMLGAGMLRANIEHRPLPLAALFGFSRLDNSLAEKASKTVWKTREHEAV
ncbi:MAG: FAD-binding oxidoreductase [Natronospirillum sp.]|uniref:NAD(P)/FAD-dependent oxidoreductase n=1 Tax=Natronospirillum sp. TaxID=2812955 RepID=UPI0025DFA024|nr:FAD-dependent oxidoreductase [Natronospirillum sp.]MCH8551670.1 FAD-binding oxidoreductase [Natronospirillum sp.]